MDQQIFSDGIGQVVVIGGTVRLDFVAYSPTEKDANGQHVPVLCQRVIMSIEGFMNSAVKIQETAAAITKLAQRARDSQMSEPPAPAVAEAMSAEPPATKRPFP